MWSLPSGFIQKLILRNLRMGPEKISITGFLLRITGSDLIRLIPKKYSGCLAGFIQLTNLREPVSVWRSAKKLWKNIADLFRQEGKQMKVQHSRFRFPISTKR